MMSSSSVRAFSPVIVFLLIYVGVFTSGCADPRVSRPLLLNASDDARMIDGEQVAAASRTPHERATLGIQFFSSSGELIGSCTSILIRQDVILTAAHCLDGVYVPGIASYRVRSGADINDPTGEDSGARMLRKGSIRLHPRYQSRARMVNGVTWPFYDHDLALAVLERPMDASVQPQPMAKKGETVRPAQQLMAYGFGRSTDLNQISRSVEGRKFRTLQRGTMIASSDRLEDRVFTRSDSKSFLCNGDSGGPVFNAVGKKVIQPEVVAINSASKGKRFLQGLTVETCRGRSVIQPIGPEREWIDQTLAEYGRL